MQNQVRHLRVWIALTTFVCGSSHVAVADDAREDGRVYLVGMGPGDPELLTIKARNVLKEADRIYCFGYLKQEVAPFARPDALTVASPLLMARYRSSDPEKLQGEQRKKALESAEESAKFVRRVQELVASGKTVAIATAGDPTIFCPWSWVMHELADSNPAIVPGLSSFNAASAALKRSITAKGGAVLLSSGDNLGTADKDGRLKMTLVFFTHRTKIHQLVHRLLDCYPKDTPLAIVCEASYDRQQVVWSTLGTITETLEKRQLPHLYLVYVGDGLAKPTK